jgi:hypothetical protein
MVYILPLVAGLSSGLSGTHFLPPPPETVGTVHLYCAQSVSCLSRLFRSRMMQLYRSALKPCIFVKLPLHQGSMSLVITRTVVQFYPIEFYLERSLPNCFASMPNCSVLQRKHLSGLFQITVPLQCFT